jgi:hypothetical protein
VGVVVSGRAHAIIVIIAVAALAFILRLVSMRQLRSKYALLWLVIGFALLVLAIFPGALDQLASWLGMRDASAAFLLLAVGFLGAVVVHVTWELSRLETRTRTLAEDVALLRAALSQSAPARAGDPPGDARE